MESLRRGACRRRSAISSAAGDGFWRGIDTPIDMLIFLSATRLYGRRRL